MSIWYLLLSEWRNEGMGDCWGKQVCMSAPIFQVPGKNSEYRPTGYSPTVTKCCAVVVKQPQSGCLSDLWNTFLSVPLNPKIQFCSSVEKHVPCLFPIPLTIIINRLYYCSKNKSYVLTKFGILSMEDSWHSSWKLISLTFCFRHPGSQIINGIEE